ncbi:hypothetical protein [Candidatus Mycobacterium methanotrophicum]|uniref:Uncharacterized protein n=1 Tax=Candidatus Mycobacterium methanotrophicum TaxID=2943498 RepID=A0ABY4QI02_9MYCO|nr:hypothetical protein [Candidatus Mycobacterium methanotrophicum]UQX09340.1 hypothetical protein M5I08_12900 [Candidatus Mycobacterium methanotrophicum]
MIGVLSRSATFAMFTLLAAGLVARTMGRTVAGMPAGAGMAALVSFHSACRLFSTYRRDSRPIAAVCGLKVPGPAGYELITAGQVP